MLHFMIGCISSMHEIKVYGRQEVVKTIYAALQSTKLIFHQWISFDKMAKKKAQVVCSITDIIPLFWFQTSNFQ